MKLFEKIKSVFGTDDIEVFDESQVDVSRLQLELAKAKDDYRKLQDILDAKETEIEHLAKSNRFLIQRNYHLEIVNRCNAERMIERGA